jgi:hypothetical protein
MRTTRSLDPEEKNGFTAEAEARAAAAPRRFRRRRRVPTRVLFIGARSVKTCSIRAAFHIPKEAEMKRAAQWTIPVIVASVLGWSGGSPALAQSAGGARPTAAMQKSGAAPKAAAKRASGSVKAVSGDSLTVSAAGKDMTFAIDSSTSVVARGASTKSAAKGGKLMITDAVNMGDRVTVSYHEMDGKMHASEVRVTAKGTAK